MDSDFNWLGVFTFRLGEFRWLTVNITFSDTDIVVSCLAITSRASPVGADALCISVHEVISKRALSAKLGAAFIKKY